MLGTVSDETLVTRALAGSNSAWLKLVKRYEKRVYNYALRMVGHPDDGQRPFTTGWQALSFIDEVDRRIVDWATGHVEGVSVPILQGINIRPRDNHNKDATNKSARSRQ